MTVNIPNWTSANLSDISLVVRGITFPASAKLNEWSIDRVCCLRTSNIQKKLDLRDVYFVDRSYVKREEQIVQPGDILMSMANSYELVGKVARADNLIYPSAFGAFLAAVRPTDVINGSYLFNFLKSSEAQRKLREGSSQTTNIANISASTLGKLEIPLPPLAEQRRIADKLDTTLARVDVLNDRLARITPLLKRFRQSVLAAATSGRLTEDWRESGLNLEKSSIEKVDLPEGFKRLSKQSFKQVKIAFADQGIPDSWLYCTVADFYKSNILLDFADGNHGSLYPRKEEFSDEGVIFLTASQLDDFGRVNLKDCQRLNFEKASKLTKGWAKHDDVVLSHNATVGRVGIVDSKNEDVLLGTSLTFYRFNKNYYNPKFAKIVFSSRFFQDQLFASMEQTTRNQVPITKQIGLNLVFPPILEQCEIVRRVETLFAFADRLEARLQSAQTAAERLTPALLAKAFRGELVPQDPNDEPATELLRRLREARAADTTSKPKRGRAAKAKAVTE